MSKLKIYIAILVLLFCILIALDMGQRKPLDWRPTYSIHDKIPLGTWVLDHEIDTLLHQKVARIDVTPYEFLKANYNYDTLVNYKVKGTLLTISGSMSIDRLSAQELLNYAAAGNSVFLSMPYFSGALKDSLKIHMYGSIELKDSIPMSLANPQFRKKKYSFIEGVTEGYFSKYDTASTTVLGYVGKKNKLANFIKVRYKKGFFYLHTQPAAFANYYLLKNNHSEYAQRLLSYLPEGKVIWFTKDVSGGISNSKLRFIFSQPALKWAWLLFIFGMLGFMIFNAKRKQRIVPIIEPLSNTTVDFAKTVGNLFYQEGDHNAVIDKKIIYFLEKVRNDYLIDTAVLDTAFMRKLQQKSGREMDVIEHAIYLINAHRRSPHSAVEEDLIHINTALEKIIN
jgi:hypothetical protein